MCAKREERAMLQPVADLHEEFMGEGLHDILPDLNYAGVRLFFGVLENV
jgi:hypothetical protein